ncbi:MAG TPA: TonB-dependent receptor [Vicinamibacterales bacterium]|nr:TonB-dependent receptor [Vicinamibacterales bacterium]
MIAALILALATSISGVVHDSSGGVVGGAAVIVRSASGAETRVTTGPDGRFVVETPETGEVTIVVLAGGFAEHTQKVPVSSNVIDITVQPAGLLETVTVTPSRTEQRLGDVPASVSLVTSEQIDASPALLADDVLKQIPSFSLFRRTSSLVAQPTAQGVSLRGIGPSGQSRTLVLLDGIPFNDPFGGWVYWTRVPLESVDRVEITEDSSSSLYGNMAMGGVINIITSRPARKTIELDPTYGNHNTPKFDFFGSNQWNKVSAIVQGSFLQTDGFPIVADIERGPIDNNADVAYKNLTGKVEFDPSDRFQGFVRAGYFSENRNNGKVGELNDTRWTTVYGGLRTRLADDSDLQARVFVDVQRAHFNFLAVTNAATTRNVVRLATDQIVPTNGVGGMAQWAKALGHNNAFSAGFDWRWVDGDSEEGGYVPAVPTSITGVTQAATLSTQRVSGGTQQSLGAFVQDIFTPMDKLVLTLSARLDNWKNYDGHFIETSVATGLPTANNRPTIPDSNDTVVSPHIAAMYHASDRVSVWGAANSGFRAPTLTELYRQFAVGAVTTRPNDQLQPERLVSGEVGVNVAPAKNVSLRVTWFDNKVTNPVLNVTLSPTLAQKQNIPETKVQGVQTDIEYRLGTEWRFFAAYVYDNAKVVDGGPANVALNGKWLQQVPENRGSFQVAYTNAKYATVTLGVQIVGLQYNDDLNVNFIPPATLASAGYDSNAYPAGLPGFTSVDLSVAHNFTPNIQAFFGMQNMLGKTYFVQTNPSTIGTPRLVNVGMRVRFSGR